MKKDKTSKTLRKRLDKIQEGCLAMSPGFSMPSIHAFRIQVKKLESYLELLSTEKKHAGRLKISGKLKNVYHVAGEIRNLQLQKQRLKKARSSIETKQPDTYTNILKVEIFMLKNDILPAISRRNSFSKEFKRLLKTAPHNIGKKQIAKFVKQKAGELNEIIGRGKFADDELHQARKIFKYFMYDSQFLKKYRRTDRAEGLINSKAFEAITELVGKFHDLVIALSMIDRELEARVFWENEKENLTRIRDEWARQKQQLYQQIVKEMDKLRQAPGPNSDTARTNAGG